MLPGFGRGAPGTPGRCIPEFPPALNGLFPGRGPVGRMPLAPVNGLFPGRGPAGFGAAGASALAAGAAGASGVVAAGAAGAGAGAGTGVGVGVGTGVGAGPGVGVAAAGAVGAAGVGAAGLGAPSAGLGTAFLAAAFLAGAFFSGASAGASGYASRNLRATGASIVEEADLTNSPISCSFARAVLLSIPSSFATSYTRALATVLRPGPGACSDPIRAYTGS